MSDDKKIKGVKINNKLDIECDYLVCNSDPPNVYKNLIKSKKIMVFCLIKNQKDELFYGTVCLLFWLKNNTKM